MLNPILVLIIVIQLIVIVWLWKKPKPKPKPAPTTDRDAIIIDWLELVMRKPDPFTELVRHAEAAQAGKASAIDGAKTISYLLQKLEERGKLRQVETYNTVISFNPSIHRSAKQFQPGEKVLVIEPGWRFNAKIFKYPVVTQLQRSHL